MKRQLDDYYDKFYNKMGERYHSLIADNFDKAKKIAAWKEEVAAKWNEIEVVSSSINGEVTKTAIEAGKEYDLSIVIDEKGLDNALGVEIVCTKADEVNGEHRIYSVHEMDLVKKEGTLYTFGTKYTMANSGSFKVAFRIYPKNSALPHRQDFCYVKWYNS